MNERKEQTSDPDFEASSLRPLLLLLSLRSSFLSTEKICTQISFFSFSFFRTEGDRKASVETSVRSLPSRVACSPLLSPNTQSTQAPPKLHISSPIHLSQFSSSLSTTPFTLPSSFSLSSLVGHLSSTSHALPLANAPTTFQIPSSDHLRSGESDSTRIRSGEQEVVNRGGRVGRKESSEPGGAFRGEWQDGEGSWRTRGEQER